MRVIYSWALGVVQADSQGGDAVALVELPVDLHKRRKNQTLLLTGKVALIEDMFYTFIVQC